MTKRRAIRFLGLYCACAILASTRVLAPPLKAPQGASTPPAASAASPKSDLQSVLATADAVLAQMSRITGLPIKAPLQKKIVSRDEVKKFLIEDLHAENSPEEMHAQEASLRAFGLVGPDFNLEKFLVAFYTEQVAGFYDPRAKTMYIADWVTPEMQEMVLAHELTHALQDQNYDLYKFLHAQRDNDDATNARQAVAEGHAMAAMMQHAMGSTDLGSLPDIEPMMAGAANEQLKAYPAFTTAPFFFRLQALFPYLQGMGFMQRGLATGGWPKVDALFTSPPASTKELFEPAVYFNHQPLPKVSLAKPPPLANLPGLRFLTENTMGELGYHALIGQLISEDEEKAIAGDWMGDRYLVYEFEDKKGANSQSDFILISRTKWANAAKAQVFFHDYQTILENKHPDLKADEGSKGDLFIGETGGSRVVLLLRNDEVMWAEGIPAGQKDAMLDYFKSL